MGSQAVVIVDGQHFVNYVDGAAVNRVIREFYASLASAPDVPSPRSGPA